MIGPRAFAAVSRVIWLLWSGPARVELHRAWGLTDGGMVASSISLCWWTDWQASTRRKTYRVLPPQYR